MAEQPKIKITARPSEHDLKETAKRLEQAGLPQDGQPEPQAKPEDDKNAPTQADVQTGTPVIKGALQQQKRREEDDPRERGDVLER